MKKIFLIVGIFITISFSVFYSLNRDKKPIEVKCDKNLAAFDIGSGTTKLKIVKVNVCEKKFIKVLSYMTMPVPYAQDLKENNGKFSAAIQNYGAEVIGRYVRASKSFNVDKILGVATSAFRKSSNGKELIKKWNKKFSVDFRVIDQREEALIGYDSVRLHDSHEYAVWDIGGGSMQVVENSDGKPFIYLGNIASVTFKNKLMKKLKIDGSSPNPVDRKVFDYAVNLSIELFSEELRVNKLKKFSPGFKFVGIGGLHKSLLPKNQDYYTFENLEERATRFIGKTDAEINSKYSDTMVTNIALIMGFMKLFDISKIHVSDVVLSDGLIYQELIY